MADLEGYALMVAEADWGAIAHTSATVIGVFAIWYLLHIQITPIQTDTGHDSVFSSDTLQQAGGDATSTLLRSSTTTHIPTATITQTVTATADPDKIASSLAKQLSPVLESQIVSLKQELMAAQARHSLYMAIGLLLMFLLVTAFWYFRMYRPVYKALREERDRNTADRSNYNTIRTTIDLSPAPDKPSDAEELTNGEQRNDNGGLSKQKSINTDTINLTPILPQESNPDETPTDDGQPKGNGTFLEHTSAGTGTADISPTPEEPVNEELADATHGEEQPLARDPLPESSPTVEETPVVEEAALATEDLTPSEALKNARKLIQPVLASVATCANKKDTLHAMVECYRRHLKEMYLKRFNEVHTKEKADELIWSKLNDITICIDTDLSTSKKTMAVLRSRVRQKLEEHYELIQAPINDAELLCYKRDYALTVLDQISAAPNMSAESKRLLEGLEMLDRLILVRSRDEMVVAIGEHYKELAAAKRAVELSTAA